MSESVWIVELALTLKKKKVLAVAASLELAESMLPNKCHIKEKRMNGAERVYCDGGGFGGSYIITEWPIGFSMIRQEVKP